jgi:hypothetical protein
VLGVLPKRLPPVLGVLVVPKPPVRFCWPPKREPDWVCVLLLAPNPASGEIYVSQLSTKIRIYEHV